MEAIGSLPIYCFVLFYRFNLLAHFDKCSPELWKSRLLKTKPKEKTQMLESKTHGQKKLETPRHKNHPKTRIRNLSKTLLKFRDRAKIFWDPLKCNVFC